MGNAGFSNAIGRIPGFTAEGAKGIGITASGTAARFKIGTIGNIKRL
mgnify:CR=1 FL=1